MRIAYFVDGSSASSQYNNTAMVQLYDSSASSRYNIAAMLCHGMTARPAANINNNHGAGVISLRTSACMQILLRARVCACVRACVRVCSTWLATVASGLYGSSPL